MSVNLDSNQGPFVYKTKALPTELLTGDWFANYTVFAKSRQRKADDGLAIVRFSSPFTSSLHPYYYIRHCATDFFIVLRIVGRGAVTDGQDNGGLQIHFR